MVDPDPGAMSVDYRCLWSRWEPNNFSSPSIAVGFLFCTLQPILSTNVAATKAGVRNYVVDLFTHSYCCHKLKEEDEEEEEANRGTDHQGRY